MTSSRRGGDDVKAIEALESRLGYRFTDRDHTRRALRHRSWAHEKGRAGDDNETLEFLGDAVLALGISGMLLDRFPDEEVGSLARSRAFLVSERNLARRARVMGLGAFLLLGRGEERGGGREKDSILADGYEALLAAVYLDGGLEAALALIARHFRAQIAAMKPGARRHQDCKTDLQEALQAVGLPVPEYRVVGETGPAHRRSFRIALAISGRACATGWGRTKKAAEQMAARRALRGIKDLIPRLQQESAVRDHRGAE